MELLNTLWLGMPVWLSFICLMLVEIADLVLAIDSVPAVLSLSVTAGLLAGGILFSLWKTRGAKTQQVNNAI
jgi:tellurite resistance protein TerC